MGKFDKVEEYYKAALETDPQNLTIRADYAYHLHTNNQLEEAEKQYKFLIMNGLKNKSLNYNYVHLLYEIDRFKEAAKRCKAFLKDDPENANIRFFYSLSIINLPRVSDNKVIKEMEKAARSFAERGDNFHEHMTRAIVYSVLAKKYYHLAQEYNIDITNSRCWKYTDISGDEYIESGKQSGEGPKGELLTEGYIMKGQAKIRNVILYTIYPNEGSNPENFKRIIIGIQEASEFYQKADNSSLEENKIFNACSISMSVFADMLDCMRAIIEKSTYPDLENKVPVWKNKLSYSYEVYTGNKKGELLVESLYKAIDCMQNLKKYKENAMALDELAVEQCIRELIQVINNLDGPLRVIFQTSIEQMDIHMEKITTWNGTLTPHFNLPEPEPSGLKKFEIKMVNISKPIIKSMTFWIVTVLVIIIEIILNTRSIDIANMFNSFISLLSKYFN